MDTRRRLLIAKHSPAGLPSILKTLDSTSVEVVAYCDAPPLIRHQNGDPGFDVCLIDLRMLRRVHRKHPQEIGRIQQSCVVVLLVHSKHLLRARAHSDSIHGVALADQLLSHLNESLLLAQHAHSLLPAGLLNALVSESGRIAALASLSASERIVLEHLSSAKTNEAIAALMNTDQNIVKALVRSVLAKLNLTNRTEAAMFALRQNFMTPRKSAEDLGT